MQPSPKPQKKPEPGKPFVPAKGPLRPSEASEARAWRSAGSVKNQFENLGKAAVQQAGEASIGAVKDMPAQLFGQVPTQEQLVAQQQEAQKKAAEKRQKEVRMVNALQAELRDIENREEQEKVQKAQVEEQQKAAERQQKAQAGQFVEEPTSAPKKGLMGGQSRKRKQTQMETGKVTG